MTSLRTLLRRRSLFYELSTAVAVRFREEGAPGGFMVVRSRDALRRSFLGVDFVLLSHGAKSMVTKMLYRKEDKVPVHRQSRSGKTGQ
jgi:hypothetical protein